MEKKKAKKNVYTNELGERKGKVFIQQQDLKTIATRKFKKQFVPKSKSRIEAEDVWFIYLIKNILFGSL